jgi:RND family efflux transporter MFP subunit
MYRNLHRRFFVVALLAAAATVPACSEPKTAAEAAPPLAVQAGSARSVMTAEQLQAGGVVSAHETATLSSRVMAPITAVRVTAGERVRAGQVLVVLDGRDLAAQATQAAAVTSAAEQGLAVARAELQAAQSKQTLAAAWHTRISSLHGRNSATTQELEEAQARLAGATARVEGARARIEQATSAAGATRAGMEAATTIRGFATIVAPFNGIVTERLVDPGSLASPGVPLLRLDADGARKVIVMVDENRTAYLEPGAEVDVTLGRDSGGLDGAAKGTVTRIARQVESGSRAFSVEVTLPKDVTATSGSFARVTFAGLPRRALVIPLAAVVRRGQLASTFVIDGDVARLRLLHTGEALAEGLEVLAGLDSGERVVLSPPPALTDGRRVTLAPAAPGDRK